jgi:DNA-binding winged helix-turn-helix (wHTH) protein
MSSVIHFNHFTVNLQTRELLAGGRPVKLQNKSFDLLVYLLKNRDRAVSKDELLDQLWKDRVVTEGVLSHATTKLRSALGDSHGKGVLIRTVYGFGLQFVGQVRDVAEVPAFESAEHQEAGNPSTRQTGLVHWLIPFGLTVLLVVWLLY